MKANPKLPHKDRCLKIDIKILALFCIFIYFPAFKFSEIASYLIEYGIPLFYVFKNRKLFNNLGRKTVNLLLLSLSIIVLSVITPIAHMTGDFSYLVASTYILRKALIYTFLAIVLIKQRKTETTMKDFLYYFSLSTAIYVLGTIILVLLPPIKTLWFSIFAIPEKSEKLLMSYGYTFRIGWVGFSGFRLTMRCAFSCIFLMFLHYSKERYICKSQFYVPYVLCLLGTMFYGRSGLAVAAISSLILIICLNLRQAKRIRGFAIMAIILALSLYALKDVPIISQWHYWFTKPFINLMTKGTFDNYSFNKTRQMVFLPDAKTIILGDGYYMQDGHYYQNTDSGIMRNILFWGMLGAILSYGTTLYSISDIRKISKSLLCVILIAIIIFEYKGEIYYEVLPFAMMWPLINDVGNGHMRSIGKKR